MRIAVTGREGQIATALAEMGSAEGIDVVLVGRPELDLGRPETILPALEAVRPDVVVSAAAFTAVDKAESDPDLAHAINAEGAGAVAAAAARLGAPVLHLSTDYVFDGSAPRPYREDDLTGPLSVYGRTKLDGEAAVASANPRHVILRTAWVYAPFGANFVRTMLRVAGARDEVSVVADQRGCPTAAPDIARALIAIARRITLPTSTEIETAAIEASLAGEAFAATIMPPAQASSELFGVFHLTGQGEAVWADVAEAVFACSAARGGPAARVKRISTTDYPTPARRPANSRLDGTKLARIYGLTLPPWRQSLEACVTRLLD